MKLTQAELEAHKINMGRHLKRIRLARGWTIRKLADTMNVSPGSLVNIENFHTTPHYDTLMRIMAVYDIDFMGMVKEAIDDQVDLWENMEERQKHEAIFGIHKGDYVQALKTVPKAMARGKVYTVGQTSKDAIHFVGDDSKWTWQPKDKFRKVLIDE